MDCYTIIDPNERGIDVRLGEMQGEVIQPGIHFRTPFITSTKKFALKPKVYEVAFSVGNDGAITKDMQTVGATVAVRYVYDESRIKDIVTQYANDSVIEGAMRDNVKASLKETTGKYSIYDLVAHQNEITAEVANAMLTRMSDYPIAINQTTITNWDWSDDFDRQIKETANRTQQVKQAEQEEQEKDRFFTDMTKDGENIPMDLKATYYELNAEIIKVWIRHIGYLRELKFCVEADTVTFSEFEKVLDSAYDYFIDTYDGMSGAIRSMQINKSIREILSDEEAQENCYLKSLEYRNRIISMYKKGLEEIEVYLTEHASEHDGYQIRSDVSDIIRDVEKAVDKAGEL